MPKKTQNKKRSVSGKRGKPAARKRKQNSSVSVDNRGIWGILLFSVGVLSFACQFIPSNGGILEITKYLVRGLGGQLCLLLPLLLCLIGAFLTLGGTAEFLNLRIVGSAFVMFWLIESLLQILRSNNIITSLNADGQVPGWISYMGRSFRLSSLESSGGGWIGSVLAWPLYRAFDIWGGAILIVVALVIVLMIATGISFGSVGARLSDWADDFRIRLGEKLQQIRDQHEVQAERRIELERERKEREEAQAKEKQRREAEPAVDEMPVEESFEESVHAQQFSRSMKKAQREDTETPLFVDQQAKKRAEVIHDNAERTTPKEALHVNRSYDAVPLYIAPENDFSRESPSAGRKESVTNSFSEEADNTFMYGIRGNSGMASTSAAPSASMTPEAGSVLQADFNNTDDVAPLKVSENNSEPSITPFSMQQPAQEDAPDKTADVLEAQDNLLSNENIESDNEPDSFDLQGDVKASAVTDRRVSINYEAADGDDDVTITTLREHRLDATPVIVPQKDTHEMPEPAVDTYDAPPIELLERSRTQADPQREIRDRENGKKLIDTLNSFGVKAELKNYTHGPAITRFEIQPAPGVKVSRITTLADDIALNLAADGVRIEAPVPGKPVVGIEVPNSRIETVCLREMIESEAWRKENSPTAVALGKGISGNPVIADMAKMPHVLIAGATGSGKSVCINTIIQSILFHASPKEVRLILIDPKVVELSVYNGIPHLLIPVVTDPKKASAALSWAVVEMEHRYKQFETMHVRDIKGYNAAIGPTEQPMAKIIVIIDELADLMMVAPGEVEESICRLAQLARAAGIHLVIATQRPSVNVITGVIKANIPSRIAFAVSSQIDSRTILDAGGAEKLLGKGDMLYAPQGAGKPTRVQGCFVSDDEVQRVVNHVKNLHEEKYDDEVIAQLETAGNEEKGAEAESSGSNELNDEMLVKAIELAIDAGQVSISMLQRRLRVGYARAGRLVDEMTQMGITGEAEGPTKPRKVLITREEWKQMQENRG